MPPRIPPGRPPPPPPPPGGGPPPGRPPPPAPDAAACVQAVLPVSTLMAKRLSRSLRPKSVPSRTMGELNFTAVSGLLHRDVATSLSPFFSSFTALVPRLLPE